MKSKTERDLMRVPKTQSLRHRGSVLGAAGLLIVCALSSLAVGQDEKPPAKRPNILIVLADDLGFSDIGAYGGEIDTPHLDALARNGLRFTQFYSTARCWPSRTALLTGYYPQQVRMDPLRRSFSRIPPWARMLPHYLDQAGYRSYHSGKWHIHLANKPVAKGGFDRSYWLRDHNRFFSPQAHFLDDEQLPPVKEEADYYATDAIASHAIEFLREHEQDHDQSPWFTYLAFTAPHFPLHAPQDLIDQYRSRYEKGWDAVRRQRLKRMKEQGIVAADLSLPPRQPKVVPEWNIWSEDLKPVFGPQAEHDQFPWMNRSIDEVFGPGEVGRAVAWDSLTAEQKQFQATKMAIHAAMVDRMDQQLGRVLAQIKAMGDRENTIVLFMSDNGASAEMIVRGDGHDPEAPMGSGDTYLSIGPGWSTAANTPFRLHKHWTHEGGAASPLIVNWPAGIASDQAGQLRHTPSHLIDLWPTLMQVADLPRKRDHAVAPTMPGRSLVPAFDKDTTIQREQIFFSHDGNQALRQGRWKIVKRKDQDAWQLYDMRADRSEQNDLASQNSERVRRMSQRWQTLQQRYKEQATREYRDTP
jgi:arylsulfatase